MNAKFEKWLASQAECWSPEQAAFDAWRASIQSLEVTPELVKVYCAAVNEYLCNLSKKQWLLERADPVGSIERAATVGLTAVLSALKEQAK